jgi:polysaccharide pyruvyl transferase WcaK-like protein
MPDILITFATLSVSKGSAAQVISFLSEARALRDDLNITLVSHHSDLDARAARPLGVNLVGYPLGRATRLNSRSLFMLLTRLRVLAGGALEGAGLPHEFITREQVARAYRGADLILDFSGDSYRDRPGGVSIAHNVNLLAARAARVPCVLMSQSLGPFRRYNRPLTRHCLNRAKLIYIRELRTAELLLRLGVKPELLFLAPDLAFCLPAAPTAVVSGMLEAGGISPERIPRPWVGLSLSSLTKAISRGGDGNSYFAAMGRLVRHVRERLNASVFLVPHEINPPQLGEDDVAAAEKFVEMMGRPGWLHAVAGDCGPCELKGLIASFDAFVGGRMHAAIAALSSGVPTMAVSWSHKYEGLMEQIGMPEFSWSVSDKAGRDPADIFDALWRRRAAVRGRLIGFTEFSRPLIREAVRRTLGVIGGGPLTEAARQPETLAAPGLTGRGRQAWGFARRRDRG